MADFIEVYKGGFADNDSGRAFTGRMIIKDPYLCEVCKRPRLCLVTTIRNDADKGYVPPVGICGTCLSKAFKIADEALR